ncbi:MAG: AraC family transcriptional regulator [Pigmentiphaga sp.]|uniref:AraC family transcriptional regulator n=1 Tax=Pigmentiphaga sp. TaxID=1977564 RepID=UPI0029B34D6F|nr:AraC family transcriptional regulator [Pigmentiphaga sp.]MDX3905849.1 AraC family transcriptional regulator [Pigmentiphaga sp.]
MKSQTRNHYERRLEPVLAWLAAHPDEDADLYRLAELACLSPYHFHRVYRAMVGETVAATVQRVRLLRASAELQAGSRSLDQVARRAGYGSTAAFSRAFGTAFGMPPGRYREDRSREVIHRTKELTMHTVKIESFPGLSLAALPHVGDYLQVGATFDRLFMLAANRGLLRGQQRCFGVYYDDPKQVQLQELRADAGIEVSAAAALADPLHRVDLRAGRCAVLEHIGPYSELETAYEWLFGGWLPRSGEQPADFPVFEEYLDDPKSTPPSDLRTRIYLPLADRA